ncbi:MAG: glucose-1-phosphate adenylyltransferase [Candidatus Sumerlaeia bacterium]|nr:glucose-1-phosphate adenylyltransferase [Candidatus Sumerlaeia bacterium]
MKRILTLILGGGAGTRLFPLTKYRAKPAVPLAGKYRLIDVAISNCINSDLKKIYVLTQYLSASLNRHVSQSYAFDQFNQGFVDILAAEQRAEDSSWFQGTADAVRKHWATLDNFDCDMIMILPGDALYRMDFRPMVERHIAAGSDISVAVNTVPRKIAHHFGLLAIDEEENIISFKEKPKTREEQEGLEAPPATLARFGVTEPNKDTFLASMGIYLFNRNALHDWMMNTGHVDFGKQIIPEAIDTQKVTAFIHSDYWEDIGTIDAFYEAHMDLLKPKPPYRFADPSRPVFTRPRFLPNTKIHGANLDQTAVADGCEIGRANIHRSVVGLRTHIGDFSTIEDSIIMGADSYDPAPRAPWESGTIEIPLGIGKYCHIRRAILDKNVRIGDNVKILNEANVDNADGEFYYIREGIVIVPKNASVPSGTVI